MIYLDYSTNAPVEPGVLEAFCAIEGQLIGNANAKHGAGMEAAAAMMRATEDCAALLNVEPGELKLVNSGARGNIVVVFPDRGDRYFSKGLYDEVNL